MYPFIDGCAAVQRRARTRSRTRGSWPCTRHTDDKHTRGGPRPPPMGRPRPGSALNPPPQLPPAQEVPRGRGGPRSPAQGRARTEARRPDAPGSVPAPAPTRGSGHPRTARGAAGLRLPARSAPRQALARGLSPRPPPARGRAQACAPVCWWGRGRAQLGCGGGESQQHRAPCSGAAPAPVAGEGGRGRGNRGTVSQARTRGSCRIPSAPIWCLWGVRSPLPPPQGAQLPQGLLPWRPTAPATTPSIMCSLGCCLHSSHCNGSWGEVPGPAPARDPQLLPGQEQPGPK